MIVPNPLFDLLLFGLLVLAGAVDGAFPALDGAVSLLIVGGATYWAAQELSDSLLRKAGWTQESLTTSTALSVGGFIYFWWRNQSDLALLVLSIGLMMSSLMVAISVLASIGTAFREGRPTAILGWIASLGSSMALGLLSGILVLALGAPQDEIGPVYKAVAVAIAVGLWKWREVSSPPDSNPHYHNLEAQKSVGVATAMPPSRFALFPQRGTLTDRYLPMLLTGLILLIAVHGAHGNSGMPSAVAAQTASAQTPDTTGTSNTSSNP